MRLCPSSLRRIPSTDSSSTPRTRDSDRTPRGRPRCRIRRPGAHSRSPRSNSPARSARRAITAAKAGSFRSSPTSGWCSLARTAAASCGFPALSGLRLPIRSDAKVAELADAPDLGSGSRKAMGVRLPPFASASARGGGRRIDGRRAGYGETAPKLACNLRAQAGSRHQAVSASSPRPGNTPTTICNIGVNPRSSARIRL